MVEVNKRQRILVLGGRGALGQQLVHHFKEKNTWVASVDHGENTEADVNIQIDLAELTNSTQQAKWIEEKLNDVLCSGKNPPVSLDGIICVAGGWKGGNILSDEFLESVDLMGRQSVESSAVAAYLAGKFLKEGGLLVMTGAQAALTPTPSMLGYGMAKAAVHHLIKSLACEGSGLPKNCVVIGLLPRTLDTPNNRKYAAGNVDFGTWTPLNYVSGLIETWLTPQSVGNSVASGQLVEIITQDGETTTQIH